MKTNRLESQTKEHENIKQEALTEIQRLHLEKIYDYNNKLIELQFNIDHLLKQYKHL